MTELSFLWVQDHTSMIQVQLDDEPMIDAAVELYLSSNNTRDTLLLLTTVAGIAYKIRASAIVSWWASTPESRARNREIDAAIEAESTPPWEMSNG